MRSMSGLYADGEDLHIAREGDAFLGGGNENAFQRLDFLTADLSLALGAAQADKAVFDGESDRICK